MEILKINDIHKSFRSGFLGRESKILRGLSFSLHKGEVFGFLGHNGAGKSTTMKVILGLLNADSGSVSIFGDNQLTVQTRHRIGYLSEEIGLYPHLNGVEMLRLVGELFRIPRRALGGKVDELLSVVGLSDKRDVKIRHYSKGMRQRLGLALALVNDPELLLLDEPYSGLDPVGRKDLRELLLQLKAQGKTIMLSSHIVPDVEAVCDRVGIIRDGKLARVLDLHEIYADNTNDVEVVISGAGRDRLDARDYGGEQMHSDASVTIIRCSGDRRLQSLVNHVYENGATVVAVRQVRLNLEDILVEEVTSHQAGKRAGDGIASDQLISTEGN